MCRHLMDNPDHKVDFAKPNILSSSGDSARLLILESLFIQKYEPLLNVDSKSAPLYLSINQSIFWTRLSLGGRGGSSSSWSLQASRSSATKDRCSAGMPRRDQLRSST